MLIARRASRISTGRRSERPPMIHSCGPAWVTVVLMRSLPSEIDGQGLGASAGDAEHRHFLGLHPTPGGDGVALVGLAVQHADLAAAADARLTRRVDGDV